MKTLLLYGAFLLALVPSAPGAESNAEESQVVEAVRSMFAAFAADDFAKFHEVAAADFYAFDGGARYQADELIEFLKKLHASGKTFAWTITEPSVHVAGEVAWITYVNDGSIGDSSGTKKMSWLESAVLRKNNGKWRVQFLHSTRVRSAD